MAWVSTWHSARVNHTTQEAVTNTTLESLNHPVYNVDTFLGREVGRISSNMTCQFNSYVCSRGCEIAMFPLVLFIDVYKYFLKPSLFKYHLILSCKT